MTKILKDALKEQEKRYEASVNYRNGFQKTLI